MSFFNKLGEKIAQPAKAQHKKQKTRLKLLN